ncbi:Sigma-54-dependent Fis family transcriptional regulator [Sulfidibacter corallicola]|uniref:Sigma-54-dependent Fis family transcriptional regulator n=1 Tax=Sulfidibacter corallicola TaxID=2818388 RepID=A0A8A4TQ22_SULCO|nr:sigma-54 dependent transcriptional regulator [Sulfidibacter corallicola]QTD51182.1 sigma-54-dependent Fis family transcriptional regulator [Sulfidibacter corallicola]
MQDVLIIDDNQTICTALQVLLDLHQIPSRQANSPLQGLALARERLPGAVIQDMNFTEDNTSGEEGERLFRDLRELDSQLPIFLITAWSSLETAVKLVKEGAYDYLRKPWDDEKLIHSLKKALDERRARATPADSRAAKSIGDLIYADAKMDRLVETALQVADADVPVLITGPNGVGKEKLAELIQAHSNRARAPFVKVNAGALPNELMEAELFGSEPGAFTGARHRIGRFEEANRGTLFLDEIGNLSLAGQMKLLRVLQTGEFSRLGSNKTIRTDVRVISATNKDLPTAITEGSFREDLFFRLNVVELRLPSLAERSADILPLARHFLNTLAETRGKSLAPESEQALVRHPWPGNVRELRNRLVRGALVCRSSQLTPADLDLKPAPVLQPVEDPSSRAEKAGIEKALFDSRGNVSKAAAALGLSRQALYRKMEKFGIVWERRPK